MKLFAIKDEILSSEKILGYLVYYENRKTFYIELAEDIDKWNFPPILSHFAEHGEFTINAFWSRKFVQQRIVPPDRQNISSILIDNGLKEYDEFALLKLANGHCEQDDCYLEELPINPLPDLLVHRWQSKVLEIVPLEVPKLLIFFRDNVAKIVECQEFIISGNCPILKNSGTFQHCGNTAGWLWSLLER